METGEALLDMSGEININMRCIEIINRKWNIINDYRININIRCIEIK